MMMKSFKIDALIQDIPTDLQNRSVGISHTHTVGTVFYVTLPQLLIKYEGKTFVAVCLESASESGASFCLTTPQS